jgi:hypothetical protein
MQSLHNHIMALVKAREEEHNNVKQNTNGKPNNVRATKAPEPFFLSWGQFTIQLSDALYAQLDRYCEANPTTLKYKPSSPYADRDGTVKPMSRAKVFRQAVYALMKDPTRVSAHMTGLPPDRPNVVGWTMPQGKREDTEQLKAMCSSRGIKPTTFARRALYLYTLEYRSPNTAEDEEARRDAWC